MPNRSIERAGETTDGYRGGVQALDFSTVDSASHFHCRKCESGFFCLLRTYPHQHENNIEYKNSKTSFFNACDLYLSDGNTLSGAAVFMCVRLLV